METKIHAHEPSTLDIGCSNGLSRTRAVASSPNYLSFAPRPVPKNGQCFDSDGPGTLSSAGARHDNDFASIKDIQILPTTDEVLCMRPPYMPHKNFNKPHFLERGPERLIDTLFRQLRHDNIERLKDCVYAAAQKLCAMEVPPQEYDPCQETQAGNRYYMYWGAELEDLRFDDRKGLFLQFSYNCPKPMRGRKMFRSGRFEKGMLMAVVGLDDDDVSLSTTFFEVLLPQCTESMESRGGNGVRAAVQLLFAQKDCEEDITRMLLYSQKLRSGRFVLVEFPKHLLNGFYPILKRMQELSCDDLGLTRYFAPRNADEENLGPLPPCYACRSTSVLDCNSLKAKSEAATAFPKYSLRNLVRDKKRFLDIVKSETTLDEGQASAFVESFSNELAFVQGPPGTGKSFLGVALTKAILAAGESGEKPILVVCMTNHALDSFLKDLIDHGVTDVARIGTGSKEDWTAKYNLKSLARSTARTEKEQKDVSKILHDVRRLSADGMDICDSVSNPDRIGWFTVAEHLKANKRYHHILKQLVITPIPGDRLHKSGLAKRASGFPYVFWSAGGDLKVFDESLAQEFSAFLGQNDPDGMKSIDNAKIIGSVLREIVSRAYDNSQTAGEENIWKLSLAERKALISKWAKEIDQKAISREILRIHFEHQDAVRQLELNRQSTDVRCLLKQKVIGMTTTACASKWDLLKQLDLKVVICEEAGEVMEAHTLCTLFQSLEHAVFIGDPLQLRPQIDERSLSLETKAGSQYRLDESLFERLMSDDSGIRKLPYAQLNVQRRMHPDISALVRRTLYPALTDHPSTHSHANIGGLSHRAYWFDHRYPESKAPAASGATKSFCNNFEVQMVYGLVRYLINTNSYARGDIAVLTPYNGQLAELVKCLHGMTNLYLSDKDKESLVDGGLLDEEDLEKNDRVDVDMLDMLRVSTIDNFQGEEAKIIILTTVRSNAENSPGFMRTDNRINVACSRARDGFFIFGNSQCLEVVPMWNSIIKIFKESARFGPSLAVTPCSREMKHCDTVFEIKEPSDFDKIPLCEAICGGRLPCGHSCSEKCHPSEFHGTGQVKCTEVCNKTHSECGHPCQKRCGEDCGSCTHKQATTELDCGHIGVVTCDKDYWGATLQCDVIVSQTSLKCGHTLSVKCDDKDKELFCSEDCKSLLACGHVCRGKCARCQESGHPPCVSKCGKELSCTHRCSVECHGTNPCPPCQEPCGKRCLHGRCEKKCSDPCDPCTQILTPTCIHQEDTAVLCCLSSCFPSCRKYEFQLQECGHSIPVSCSDKSRPVCTECKTGHRPSSPVITLPCGHCFESETLDRHVGITGAYEIDRYGFVSFIDSRKLKNCNMTCPDCGAEIHDIPAYAMISGVPKLLEETKKLIARIGGHIGIIGKRLSYHEITLRNNFPLLKMGLRPSPLSDGANRQLISQRYQALREVQEQIIAIREQLVIPIEENIERLSEMLKNSPEFVPFNMQFKTRFELLFGRVRHIFLKDVLEVSKFLDTLEDPSYQTEILARTLARTVFIHGRENIENIEHSIANCSSKKLPCLEVELRLLQLSFQCLVQRAASADDITCNSLDMEKSVSRILDLCEKYPRSAGLYKQQAESLRTSFLAKSSPGHIFMEQTRTMEKGWRECESGDITRCSASSHPYPATAFEFCPECESIEAVPEVINVAEVASTSSYEKYLAPEEDFLRWMRSRRVPA